MTEDRDILLQRYLDGETTADEAARVEAMLADDAQLRHDAGAYARINHALLESRVKVDLSESLAFLDRLNDAIDEQNAQTIKLRPRWVGAFGALSIAATLMIGLGLAFTLLRSTQESAPTPQAIVQIESPMPEGSQVLLAQAPSANVTVGTPADLSTTMLLQLFAFDPSASRIRLEPAGRD